MISIELESVPLLSIVERLGIRYDVLLLDRGYYSVPAFRYCKENKIPLIMPVKKAGWTGRYLANIDIR